MVKLSVVMKFNIGNVLHTVTLCCYSFGDRQRYMHIRTAHAYSQRYRLSCSSTYLSSGKVR